MYQTILNRVPQPEKNLTLPIILFGITFMGGVAAFPLSYVTHGNVLIGLALLPFTISVHGNTRFNMVYFLGLLFFMLLAYVYQIKIFYFFAIAFYLIFSIECLFGRVNTLLLFLVVLTSPVFIQIAGILGFPIRLHLSNWAGSILNIAGMPIHVEGNMMALQGFEFTVDEACMGLNMLATSMLMGVFIIACQYKIKKQTLPLIYLLFYFTIIFALNVTSNLFRIITLVVFKVMPGNAGHEIIGILCLLFYVMVPLYFVGNLMVKNLGKSVTVPAKNNSLPTQRAAKIVLIALAFSILLTGIHINSSTPANAIAHAKVELKNTSQVKMHKGITKLFNDSLLVYVKPIPEFFSGEHTPLFCWKGSGYQFKTIKKERVANHDIYSGTLKKGNAVLYTAWWYTDGNIHTIDQFTWRSAMLRNKKRFCLINVTTKDRPTLLKTLTTVFKNNLMSVN